MRILGSAGWKTGDKRVQQILRTAVSATTPRDFERVFLFCVLTDNVSNIRHQKIRGSLLRMRAFKRSAEFSWVGINCVRDGWRTENFRRVSASASSPKTASTT